MSLRAVAETPEPETALEAGQCIDLMRRAIRLAQSLESQRLTHGTFWPAQYVVPEPSMPETFVNGVVMNDISVRQAYAVANGHLQQLPEAARRYHFVQDGRAFSSVVHAWLGTDPVDSRNYLWQTADIPPQISAIPRGWLPNLQP